MPDVTVHYIAIDGSLKKVVVNAFHPDEIYWIGARKAKMDKATFAKAIIQVDKEGVFFLK